jgi:hypothetical protein
MARPKKHEKPVLPKGVEIIPGGRLAELLKTYGKIYEGDPNYRTAEDHLIGELVRELAWRRGALTAPQKKSPPTLTSITPDP